MRLTGGSQQTPRWRKESGANPSLEQVHASGDRLGQAGGRGYKRNGGSTPCVSYHHRRKYVRAAQDRWAPQAEEISPARRENRENRALGRDNSIQRRTARDGRFPASTRLAFAGRFCGLSGRKSEACYRAHAIRRQVVASYDFPMLILTALKRLLDRRVCPNTARNTGRSGMGRQFSYHRLFTATD
jgi:hypothetical protein